MQHMAHALRFLSVDMIEKAKSGHPGMPLGMADVATVLWTKFMRFDASNPKWFDRDRFVLSNGHGSALMYSLLYALGYPDISLDDLKNFRQLGSPTAGHPEHDLLQGVDYSTGPLGQGIAAGVGMALAERMMNAKFGDDLVNHKTYVFVGDGCLMEGISEEAISVAGHLGLNKLIVLWDDNEITIDGPTSVATSTHMKMRFEANGWHVLSCDGHNFTSIETALEKAQESDKPVFIDCKTTIGWGACEKAGTPKCHGSPLGADIIAQMRQDLNWTYEPFEIPADILEQWHSAGIKGEGTRQQWEARLERHPQKKAFLSAMNGDLPAELMVQLQTFKEQLIQEAQPMAGRKASQKVLAKLTEIIPNLIGGSADLTAANYTNTPNTVAVTRYNYGGNYINYGIREHAMAAMMNGLVVHGGFIPYAGTFLSFVDYMKPAVRLAALMKLRVLYVLTHDSIGVGEDGPTHQPIEQLAMLRATPNILTFRPADSVEVAECYEVALGYTGPSAFALSRQELSAIRQMVNENKSAKGAYVLYEPDCARDITLIATGSEVGLALKAKDSLQEQGIYVAVVSMPCMELFEAQSEEYQHTVLGTAPKLAIEAASPFGWHKWIDGNGDVIAMNSFGCSAPGGQLFEKYGFSVENVVNHALKLIHK